MYPKDSWYQDAFDPSATNVCYATDLSANWDLNISAQNPERGRVLQAAVQSKFATAASDPK